MKRTKPHLFCYFGFWSYLPGHPTPAQLNIAAARWCIERNTKKTPDRPSP